MISPHSLRSPIRPCPTHQSLTNQCNHPPPPPPPPQLNLCSPLVASIRIPDLLYKFLIRTPRFENKTHYCSSVGQSKQKYFRKQFITLPLQFLFFYNKTSTIFPIHYVLLLNLITSGGQRAGTKLELCVDK